MEFIAFKYKYKEVANYNYYSACYFETWHLSTIN